MAKTLTKHFSNFKGMDLRSNDLMRTDEFASHSTNIQQRRSGAIEKRKGSKVVSASGGGNGLIPHATFNSSTGAETQKLYTIDTTMKEYLKTTFTINYGGTGAATATFQYDTTDSKFNLTLTEDGSTVLDSNIDVAVDESSPTTLTNLETAVDAVTNFTADIGGDGSDGTVPAAYLFPLQESTVIAPSGTLVLSAYALSTVNSPLTAPFPGSESNKNDADFEYATSVTINNVTYISNGYDEVQKFDGQNLYRAGMPEPTVPTVDETNAAGQAEVTDVTCRAEAGTAEVTDITCVKNDQISEVSEYIHGSTDGLPKGDFWNGLYCIAYGWDGASSEEKVMFWIDTNDSGTAKPSGIGEDRDVEVTTVVTADNDLAVLTKVATAMNDDSDFSAVVNVDGWLKIIVTDAQGGERTDGSYGTFRYNWGGGYVNVTTQGTDTLHEKYFLISDSDERVGVWFNSTGVTGGSEPAHGGDRALEVGIDYNDANTAVGEALKLVIDADGAFGASRSSAIVTVTDAAVGERDDAADGDTGFTIAVNTQGADTLDGKYFIFTDDTDTVAFWIDVDDSGTVEPAHGAFRSVEITGVAAADSASDVATAISSGVNGDDSFSTSVASAVVTVTDAATGIRDDATAETSGFTMDVTTQGSAAGLGQNTFLYHLTHVQEDDTGLLTEGIPSDDATILLTDGTKDVVLTIFGLQADSGYNTGCAIVDGNQAAANQITVDTGHTLLVGDKAYFLDRTAGVNDYTTRNITAKAATTITVDGDPIKVTANDVISNGLRTAIWRTDQDGITTSKSLVVSIPNDSINTSQTYTDGKLDANLGSSWISPAFTHGLPPKGRYISAWNKVLMIGGQIGDENTLFYSIPGATSPEYFPAEANQITLQSPFGDSIRGLAPNNQVFVVFKDRSIHVLSGDIFNNLIRVDQIAKQEIGIQSHHSIMDVQGNLFFFDEDGVHQMSQGSFPEEVSAVMKPLFTENQGFATGTSYKFKRAIAYHDRVGEKSLVFLPVEGTSSGNKYASTESPVMVFDWFHGAWWQWDSFNMAGGMAKLGDDIFFQEKRLSTLSTVTNHLHIINRSETKQDYTDHGSAITGLYQSNWYSYGEPSVFKKWIRLKVFDEEPVRGQSVDDVTVETELAYQRGSIHSSFTLTPSSVTATKKQRLKPGKGRTIRLSFSNNDKNENMLLSGWELEAGFPYDQEIKE